MVLAQLDGSSGYITSVPEIHVNFSSVFGRISPKNRKLVMMLVVSFSL